MKRALVPAVGLAGLFFAACGGEEPDEDAGLDAEPTGMAARFTRLDIVQPESIDDTILEDAINDFFEDGDVVWLLQIDSDAATFRFGSGSERRNLYEFAATAESTVAGRATLDGSGFDVPAEGAIEHVVLVATDGDPALPFSELRITGNIEGVAVRNGEMTGLITFEDSVDHAWADSIEICTFVSRDFLSEECLNVVRCMTGQEPAPPTACDELFLPDTELGDDWAWSWSASFEAEAVTIAE